MGKSNRIRNDRANATLTKLSAPKQKKGMPSWALNLITIVVAAVILFSVAFSLLSANGVFARMQTAMKSDNFRVNSNMMKYYFQTQYQSFVSQNSSYLTALGLDTGLSLKDQTMSTGENAQTWFDYMMGQTEAQVKEILVYCEEAEARGIKLEDEDKEAIDAELEMLDMYAQMYGYTTNSYISSMYGKGVQKSDVRNCLELSTLASKCGKALGEEIENAILDADIETKYNAGKRDYNLVDMITYTFTVSYDDAKKACASDADSATIVAKYKEMIEEAKNNAKALAEAKSEDAFNDIIADYVVKDAYDEIYEDAVEDSDVADADLVKDENEVEKIKTALIAHITDLIKNDKDFSADDIVKDGKVLTSEVTVKDAYAGLIKEIAKDIYDASVEDIEGMKQEGVKYSDTDDATKWAFEDGRAAGNTKSFESGDGADGVAVSDDASTLKSFSTEVAYVVKPEYKNEALTKNVGIMTFSSTESANAALAKLKDGMTIAEFEAICNESGGSFTDYKDYTKGALSVSAFDTWLYGDGVVIGSYTKTVLNMSETSFALALYYADGAPEWKVSVKADIYTERYTAKAEEMTAKYAITVKEKAIARIDA